MLLRAVPSMAGFKSALVSRVVVKVPARRRRYGEFAPEIPIVGAGFKPAPAAILDECRSDQVNRVSVNTSPSCRNRLLACDAFRIPRRLGKSDPWKKMRASS